MKTDDTKNENGTEKIFGVKPPFRVVFGIKTIIISGVILLLIAAILIIIIIH